MKACVIRLWAPVIFLGGITLAAFGVRLAAQVVSSAPQASLPATQPSSRVQSEAEAAAFQALNAKRVDEAESQFKAILAKEPDNPGALAGMGYVRMEQKNFSGAISFLEQAKQNNPGDKSISATLDTARFWFSMGEGQSAVSRNDLTTAEQRYRAALALRSSNAEALEGLGGVLVKAHQPGSAIPLFERALEAEPGSTDGWRSLLMAQVAAGNSAEALATDKRMPVATHAQLMTDPLFLQALGSAYSGVGRTGDAQKALESALQLPYPEDAKGAKLDALLQLAGILVATNHLDQAAPLYTQVLNADTTNTAGWCGLAAVQHAMGHDADALDTVESMPPVTHAAAMRDPGFEATVAAIYQAEKKFDKAEALLHNTATEQSAGGQRPPDRLQMQLAGLYAEQGDPQLAYPIYQQLVRESPERADAWGGLISALHATGHDKEAAAQLASIPPTARAQLEADNGYQQTVAQVYAAVGREGETAPLPDRVEQAQGQHPPVPRADAEIQHAQQMFDGMDDAGLYRQLMNLGGRRDLTDEQRRTVQAIWTSWAALRANQAAAAGNTRRALAILNAAAASFPDNPAAIKALASGYAQAGDPEQALQIYKAQNMSKESAPDYAAAVGAALSTGDNKDAENWLRYALAAYPSDPQILLLAAKFEQARGDTARAIQYYHASLKAMPPGSGAQAVEPGLPAAETPTRMSNAGQREDLSLLLAPGVSDSSPASGAPGQPYLPSYPASISSGVSSPGQTQAGAAAPSAAGPGQEVYHPYVPYIAPAQGTATTARAGQRASSPVAVQLGGSTPPPPPPQTDVTDVLPTSRYATSSKASQAAAAQPDVAAERAARIRRLQSNPAAVKTGQSHPPAEDTITGAAQVPMPSTAPAGRLNDIPDTGEQQYPQPRTPPATGSQTSGARARQAGHPPVPPAQSQTPVAPPAKPPAPPESTQPQAKPPVPSDPHSSLPGRVLSPSAPPTTPGFPLTPIIPPPSDEELIARNLPALGADLKSQTLIPLTPRQQAEDELASLEALYSGFLGATGSGRYRGGTSGLDRLNDIEAPVEASAVIGRAVRLTAVARPVFLNSGALSPSSFSAANVPYLGTLPANAANPPEQQYSMGVGGELQLTSKYVGVAAGYTPYHFLVRSPTGRFESHLFGGHLSLFGEREPVKDTQLSYAGLRDPGVPGSGPIWGGVVSTTGGVRLDLGSQAAGFFISGDGGVLTGRHVLDNTKFKGSTGVRFLLKKWPAYGSLYLGGSASGMHYAHDEVGLTYGQGGYFSPESYFAVSAPVSFEGHRKASLQYHLSASLGVQSFEQDEEPFYPLDPSLQSSFKPASGVSCSSTQALSYSCGVIPYSVTTLFSYAVNAEASYRLGEHWYGGGFLTGNNSNNYNTVSAGFFFRYTFRSQHPTESKPSGLFPSEGFRSLQIP